MGRGKFYQKTLYCFLEIRLLCDYLKKTIILEFIFIFELIESSYGADAFSDFVQVVDCDIEIHVFSLNKG